MNTNYVVYGTDAGQVMRYVLRQKPEKQFRSDDLGSEEYPRLPTGECIFRQE
jgi:hypothetical protein